jgi:hypothetical protein
VWQLVLIVSGSGERHCVGWPTLDASACRDQVDALDMAFCQWVDTGQAELPKGSIMHVYEGCDLEIVHTDGTVIEIG